MKSFPTAYATEKNKKTGAAPVWILKCPFPSTGTLYLSDLVFTVPSWNGGITTKSWVRSWNRINEDISGDMSLTRVADFSLEVIVDPNTSPNIDTILHTAANNVEVTDCELYLWFRGLDASTDPPQLIWTGNIIDWERLDELVMRLDLVDQSQRVDKFLGTKISFGTYSYADPADIGKIGNIIYGSVQRVPCHAICARGASSLTADITAASPGNSGTLVLKDASRFPTGAFVLQIESEQISIASRSGNTLTLASSGARGYNSTTAAAHLTGAQAWEVSTDFHYLLADHPVKSIGDVYLDDQVLATGINKYTGQSGNEHASYPGKAVLAVQHGIGQVTRTTPSSASGTFANPGYAVDANWGTFAYNHYVAAVITINFPAGSGTITTQTVRVFLAIPPLMSVSVSGGWSPSSLAGGAAGIFWSGGGYMDFTKTGGGWTDTLSFTITDRDGSSEFYIWEVPYKEVQYYPFGTGDTAARIVVGDLIAADADGYQDDASGTYTGSANALIERPDHVFKHFLYIYAAWATANFSTDAATPFASDGYEFAGVLTEYRKLKEWLALMAFQCRCYFRFAAGKAYLLYRPDSLTSDKTLTAAMTATQGPPDYRTSMKIRRSRLDEVINKVQILYDRDWAKSPGDDAYKAVTAVASDSTSIGRYGTKERPELFLFDFVRLAAMAEDLRDFYLARYKDRKKVSEMELFLDNAEMEFGDAVTLAALSSLLCEAQQVNFYPGSGREGRNDKIELIAREY